MKKYYLGLNIGISSVGWAISSDEGIEDFGVQVWDIPKIMNGKSLMTNAAKRREYRSTLRFRNRQKAQKIALKDILLKENIISSAEIKDLSLGDWVKNLNDKENIYDIRCMALDKKITPKHLAWILLKYINKRGLQRYQDNKELTLNKENEANSNVFQKKKVDKKIQKAKNSINVGFKVKKNIEFPAYIIKNKHRNKNWDGKIENQKYSVKNLVFTRESLENECRCILKNQYIKQNVIDRILKIIFKQFTLEDGPDPKHGKNYNERMKNRIELEKKLKAQQDRLLKHLETEEILNKIKYLRNQRFALRHYLPQRELRGECPYTKELNAPEASIIRDCFKFCQEVIKKKVITKDSNKHEILDLIKSFFIEPEKIMLLSEFKELCKFWFYLKGTSKKTSKLSFFKNIPKINDIQNLTEEEMLQRLKEFAKFDKEVSYVFSDFITIKNQFKELRRHIIKEKITSLEDYKEKLYKSFSTFNLSETIMLKAIENFVKDKKLIDDFLYEKEVNIGFVQFKNLPKKLEDTFKITNVLNKHSNNTCVFRALTNVRKLLIDIHKYYRKKFNIPWNQRLFENINIEISDYLEFTKKEKDGFQEKQKKLKKEENEIIEILKRLRLNPNKNNQMLLKLYFEQGGKYNLNKGKEECKATCFLTNKSISVYDIKQNKVANGHIIPRIWGIDKIENRFLIFLPTNQLQGNMLPYEYVIKKNNEFKDKYNDNVKKYSKGIKSKLLKLDNKNSKEFNNLLNELLNTMVKDNRYIVSVFINWLTVELIKRDYVINNYKLIDRNGRFFNEYQKWWKEKRDEMYNQRINQISSHIVSYVRNDILFSSSELDDEKGVWSFSKKEKIKEITEWEYTIDAIALSLIHNKPALFFYEYYSRARRLYLSRISKICSVNDNEKRHKQQDELKAEIEELLSKLKTTLNKKNLYKGSYPKWYKIIEHNFTNLKNIIYNYSLKNNSKPIKAPKIAIYNNIITKIENYVNDTIPIKLKWFRINEIAYNLIYHFVENNDKAIEAYNLNWKEITNILKQQLLYNSVSQRNEFITKAIEEKESIEGEVYILFEPIFKYFNDNLLEKTKNSIFCETKIFFKAFLDYFISNKKQFTYEIFSVVDFLLILNNSCSRKNIKNKNVINNFLYRKKIENIDFSFIKVIYVAKIDDNPKKVIKYLSDGKLKNKKPLTNGTNPLGLESKNKIQKKLYKKVQNKEKIYEKELDKHYLAGIIISESENDYRNKFDSIVNSIRKLRKNYTLENQNQINEQLHKYDCIIDKNGSLWSINNYVGLLYSWDKKRFIKPITFHELNHCVVTITNAKKKIELIPFGTTVFLKKGDFKDYPFVLTNIRSKEGLQVYLKMNGVSNGFEPLKGKSFFVRGSSQIVLKSKRISFNGTLLM